MGTECIESYHNTEAIDSSGLIELARGVCVLVVVWVSDFSRGHSIRFES